MADKTIGELPNVSSITGGSNELFVVEQAGAAKNVTGLQFANWLNSMALGLGYIDSFEKTSSSGTNPVVDVYTLTFTVPDGGGQETRTITVTNGVKGDKGNTGATGATGAAAEVVAQALDYAVTNTAVQPDEEEFLPSATPVKGKYYWTRTTIEFNDGNIVKSYGVSYLGTDGEGAVDSVNGATGIVVLTADDIDTDTPGTSIQDSLDSLGTDISSKASKSSGVAVSISVADWSGGTTCTKSVTGVTASNNIVVAPDPSSSDKYAECGIKATAQGSGTVTFSASSTPDSAVTVNVLIVG